jgi:hypothetical protein
MARTPMNRTLARRLDRLEERLPTPAGPTRRWQIVIWSPEGPVNGPLIKWGPGYTLGWYYDVENKIRFLF